LIEGIELPGPDDRHVLAAAIRCGAQIIVTHNLKEFPEDTLDHYGIKAIQPDEFLEYQFGLRPDLVIKAAKLFFVAHKNKGTNRCPSSLGD
jgi:hypothetical protein